MKRSRTTDWRKGEGKKQRRLEFLQHMFGDAQGDNDDDPGVAENEMPGDDQGFNADNNDQDLHGNVGGAGSEDDEPLPEDNIDEVALLQDLEGIDEEEENGDVQEDIGGGDHGSDAENSDHDDHQFHGSGSGAASGEPLPEDNIDEVDWLQDLEGIDEEDNFNLSHPHLNIELDSRTRRTVRDAILLELALASRHGWTYECLLDSFKSKNVLSGTNYFPTTKKQLWSILGRTQAGITVHVYCDCGAYFGLKKNLPEEMDCSCGKHTVVKKAKHFFVLSLKKQLQHFLKIPGIVEALKYRENRHKVSDEGLEDIYDGECYKNLMQIMGPNDLTYVLGTDGCKSRNAKLSVYPVYLRINELPPNLRQKFPFLAAIYVGVGDPDMTAFLLPVSEELNKLSTEGVTCSVEGEECTVRLFPSCLSVDGKARWQVLNMCPHNSEFGCTMCTIKGVTIGNTVRYPTKEHPQVPAFQDRDDAGMRADMLKAVDTKNKYRGHKGLTPLMAVGHLDLAKSQAFDDLHNLYECSTAVLTELVLTVAPRLNGLGQAAMMKVIDSRMVKIQTPSKISRKPGTCLMKNRSQFNGTEWRNWLIYCSVPCLRGLVAQKYITLFELLSHATFLLSQDLIFPEDVELADRRFIRFLIAFEEEFGVEKTRLNMHASLHASKRVLYWGPLFCQSTCWIESWNMKIMALIKSLNGAELQVITRYLLSKLLEEATIDERIAEDIRIQIQNILQKKISTNYRHVGEDIHVLGEKGTQPSQEEAEVLKREDPLYNPQLLRVHKKFLSEV